MNTVIDELKTKLYKWREYYKLAKAQGLSSEASEYLAYIKELRAAIKKLKAP